MRLIPFVLKLFEADYHRQRYGPMVLWVLLFSAVLLATFYFVGQYKFHEVYATEGNALPLQDTGIHVQFEVIPEWVQRVDLDTSVVIEHQSDKASASNITHIEHELKNGEVVLIAYAPCQECGLKPSQLVDVKVIAPAISLFDMFLTTFGMD